MRIIEIRNLMKIQGDLKLSELIAKLKGNRVHECPKCVGYGSIEEKYDAYPRGLPDSGWQTDIKVRHIDCDLCEGFGYTKKELKPKLGVIGYE